MLDEREIRWFLMQGTLLGIVRDGEIIDGSGDIDLGIYGEDIFKLTNFGNGVAANFAGMPCYWNYGGGENIIINVQAYHKLGNERFYFDEKGLVQQVVEAEMPGIVPKNAAQLLTEWYGDWKTPTPGVHARVAEYKLVIDKYGN